MRWLSPLALTAACNATVGVAPDAALDARSHDTASRIPGCTDDPSLAICFSFDDSPLPASVANEGTLVLDAVLTNVTSVAAPLGGGAALLGATSEILIPANTTLVDIVAIDATIRLAADVPPNGRIGIVDSDGATPGMSLFLYAGTATAQRIRCNVGGMDLYADTSIPLDTWTRIACTCENGNVSVWRDGQRLTQLAGCLPAAGTTTGLQIGQNSNAGEGLPPNEPLIGALDRVRLWTAVPQTP